MNNLVIFETGDRSVQVWLEGETVWLSQAQIAGLFDVQKAAVSKHLKNIFASGELKQAATVSKMETVQQEGSRTVSRQVEHYNLDAIIAVGYRVNSTRATRFRQWATGVLRQRLGRSGAGRHCRLRPQLEPAAGLRRTEPDRADRQAGRYAVAAFCFSGTCA